MKNFKKNQEIKIIDPLTDKAIGKGNLIEKFEDGDAVVEITHLSVKNSSYSVGKETFFLNEEIV